MPPELPGSEFLSGDRKLVTYAEMGVVVIVLPLVAFFFAEIVPRYLGRRFDASLERRFEWAGVGFAVAFPLAMAGVGAPYALSIGVTLAILVIAAVVAIDRRRLGRTR